MQGGAHGECACGEVCAGAGAGKEGNVTCAGVGMGAGVQACRHGNVGVGGVMVHMRGSVECRFCKMYLYIALK